MAAHLCTISDLPAGRAAQVKRVLAGFPDGADSPLGRVDGTHFARWVVVPALPDRHGRPREAWGGRLLFSAEHDHATAAAYLGALLDTSAEEAHAVWRHCAGCPDRPGPAMVDWLLAAAVTPGFSVDAIPGVRVERLRDALAARRDAAAFAVEARALRGAELKRAFERRFC